MPLFDVDMLWQAATSPPVVTCYCVTLWLAMTVARWE